MIYFYLHLGQRGFGARSTATQPPANENEMED
jgi:hypothetical protein